MDKLRAIKFFCRAVEAKSFTAAAQALDVPPSVLSKAISSLEAELRFTVFNRSTRRLSLTEAGTAYYESCRQLILDMEEAEAHARDGTVRATGMLRIGFHPAFRTFLCRRIGEFLAANPSVTLELAITNSPATLLDEGLDVVLRIGEIPNSSFVALDLGSTVLIPCAAPAYLDVWGRPSHPQDLRRHRAIIPGRRDEDPFTRWTFSRHDEQEVVVVPVVAVVRDGIGMVDSALAGVGVAQIYDVVAQHCIVDGSLEPLLKDWSYMRQPVYAVIPSRRNVPAKVRAFVHFARSLVLA
jgi:LysR family transcriptional regulator, regulator for bpeEF and oprC